MSLIAYFDSHVQSTQDLVISKMVIGDLLMIKLRFGGDQP